MDRTSLLPVDSGTLADLAGKYLWWDPVDDNGHSQSRMIAQIMRFGSYEDILRLESFASPETLADVMRDSAPGWFDDRSWDFWRGRLSFSGSGGIPEQRPQRTFGRVRAL